MKDPSLDVNKEISETRYSNETTTAKKNWGKHTRNSGATPLFIASRYGYSAVVEALLSDERLDVNKGKSWVYATPLMVAIQGYGSDHLAVIRALISHPRAHLNRPGWNGLTPLMYAMHQYIRWPESRWDIIKMFRYLLRCPKMDHNLQYKKNALYDIWPANATILSLATRFNLRDITEAVQSRPKLLELGHTC